MKTNYFQKLDFKKMNGLIPVVIQDESTRQVLMLGFMNKKAYQQTIKTGLVTFFSRTRNRLWTKGESSGNYLKVIKITPDCDNDTLLILAKPKGPTCHKGTYSCFGKKMRSKKEADLSFLTELFSLIQKRKKDLPKNSYTASLFQKGLNEITKKIGEESIETIIAAQKETKNRLISESADLIYHLLVLWAEKKIELKKIINELERRSRPSSPNTRPF